MFRNKTKIMLILITLSQLFLCSLSASISAQETRLYVDPPSITGLEIDDNIQINITVSDVIDLYAWEFRLFYRNDVLNGTSIAEGPFLLTHPNPGATTFFHTPNFTDTYNATHGLIRSASTLIGVDVGVDGNGTLATITFKIIGEGDSPLTLKQTKLVDSKEPFGDLISHAIGDGAVHVGFHDIAVINTITSKTITNDTIVYLNATVENQGQAPEDFTLTAYYNTTTIETKTVTDLPAGNTIIITFEWDTTPIPKGNYIINITASTVLGETDTTDNTYLDGWITETILGDVTGDYKVDILDIATVAKAFGSRPGDPSWNSNGDFDNSNKIDILDIATAAKNYGKKL